MVKIIGGQHYYMAPAFGVYAHRFSPGITPDRRRPSRQRYQGIGGADIKLKRIRFAGHLKANEMLAEKKLVLAFVLYLRRR